MSIEDDELVEEILIKLREKHLFYYDLLTGSPECSFRQIMVAWSTIREEFELIQDEKGRYYIDAGQDRND